MKKTMFRHRQARCPCKTILRTAFWCMSILALIISFSVSGFCQDPATTGPANIAYWNGGNGAWFGSGGGTNWVCQVSGSEYNCVPPNDASWTAVIGAAGPNLNGNVGLTLNSSTTVGALLVGDGTNGSLVVTGGNTPGPTLTAGTIVVGVTHSGSTPNPDSMTISNGGMVNDLNGYIGDHGNSTIPKYSNGVVTVTGAGSQWNNSGTLEVGLNGRGTLNISAGGSVTAGIGIVGANGSSTGTVTLSGNGSTLTSSFLNVGLNGTGMLNVGSGTTVTAPQILIGTLGTVNVGSSCPACTPVTLGGALVGNVTNNGTLDPITVTNIVGNYTQGGGGTTILDVSSATSYGQLDVNGNVDISGTLDIFTNGFDHPRPGTTFDLINYTGTFSDDGLKVHIIGCPNCICMEGIQPLIGEFRCTVEPPPSPAEPGTVVLLAISLIAMAVFVGRMRHSILPDLRI